MTRTLNHRGPDASRSIAIDNVGLGHTRLGIVDIEGGHQPMSTEDGRFHLSYNGEIYNYDSLRAELERDGIQLKTRSDTEVLLRLLANNGIQALQKLRGMFAFALYDRKKQRVFLARDRLGIKPLFYAVNRSQFFAASEIKSILASGAVEPRLDLQSIRDHFRYQFSVSPHTSFEDVHELPPGHYLELSTRNSRYKIKQYWDLEYPQDGDYESESEQYWLKEFEIALADAAQTHTIGDVPIGAYLSGGLDSSATTYLLKQHYPHAFKTFSIHFTNPASDESYAYKPVAEHLRVQNEELTMEDNRAGGFFGLLRDCVYHLEQPQRLAVDIPHFLLSAFVREQGYKVVYTGDGADEILAGYDCFRQDAMRAWGNEQENYAARRKLYRTEFTQYFAPDYIELLLQLHKKNNQRRVTKRFGTYPAWYDFWQILEEPATSIFSEAFTRSTASHDRLVESAGKMKRRLHNLHPLNQSLYIETKTRLPGWILLKSDRLSMAHGVEARVPFLDHPLVELSARMPPAMKLRGMEEKYALKQIMKNRLPTIPGEYKKRGFYTPIREWFFNRQHEHEWSNWLREESVREAGVFDPSAVARLLNILSETPAPTDLNSYYHVLQQEWLLMLVLTTQQLHELFVLKKAPCFHDI